MTTKSIGQPKVWLLHISKNHKKKKDYQKKFLCVVLLIIDQFYLLMYLEGMWSFISSFMIVQVPFWDIHLHNV